MYIRFHCLVTVLLLVVGITACSSQTDALGDIGNGIQDGTRQWVYWDGQITKAEDEKCHLFGGCLAESGGHWAWFASEAFHAVSDSVMGPYTDQGRPYQDANGRGTIGLPAVGRSVLYSGQRNQKAGGDLRFGCTV